MKKVIVIGKLNQTISSINRHLATRFHTQLCADNLKAVEDMTKIYEPDMAVISLIGVGELDAQILELFKNQYAQVPVLLLGTVEECNYYCRYYESRQFDFAVRPLTLSTFMQKCFDLLRITDEEPEVHTDFYDFSGMDSRKARILAVDDSGVLLRSVKAILEKKYDVSFATSGKMAIKQAKKELPDLILLDYEMPEWDGKRTLEELRNDDELKDIPVVFLTSVADKKHILAVLELKPEGYILKPLEQERLLNTIHDVLAGIV